MAALSLIPNAALLSAARQGSKTDHLAAAPEKRCRAAGLLKPILCRRPRR